MAHLPRNRERVRSDDVLLGDTIAIDLPALLLLTQSFPEFLPMCEARQAGHVSCYLHRLGACTQIRANRLAPLDVNCPSQSE